jgi:alpha-amylase/alpha-mannosidase (GH57 family)
MKDPTAAPYHDWNDCVCEQCYKPNMAARLLNSKGEIVYITNNYRNISFNVGPTLHGWLARHNPLLAQSITQADMDAADILGEGGAVAQAYNHMILPLSAERDIRTQVVWGIRDFEYRYGRKPKGMWLPETAVDIVTLEALALEGMKFTILAPHQCARVRSPGGEWLNTPGGRDLDVTRPYFMTLPSGRKINLVFYYGSIAHDIAFGGMLDNGDFFAESLLKKLPLDGEPRLLTVATDGETYGHHHRYGDMALARAAERLANSQEVILTNIAAFLAKYEPRWECRIEENTSWSCAHGLERWRSDCGCHTGGEHWWRQEWRAPLREALDKIRDSVDEIYEKEMLRYCDSPWKLRDEAVSLYLMNFGDRVTQEDVMVRKGEFLRNFCGELQADDMRRVLTLIESQRMRMFMYTSCGWFFNDISGIETRQIMAYALRAIEYVKSLSGISLEESFLESLKKAPGNTDEFRTGYDVMTKCVLPKKRSVKNIAACAALMSKKDSYYTYRVKSGGRAYPSGDMGLSVSKLTVSDIRTLESWSGASAVLSNSGLDDVCRLSEDDIPSQKDVWRNFYVGDIFSISSYLESVFEVGPWRFRDLPQDDRDLIAAERTKFAEQYHLESAENLLENNQRLLVQLNMMGVKSSSFLHAAVSFVYEQKMKGLADDAGSILDLLKPDSRLNVLLEEAHSMGIYPEVSVLALSMERAFRDQLMSARDKNDDAAYAEVLFLWKRAAELKINIDRWFLQDIMWKILEEKSAVPSSTILELASALGFATPDIMTRKVAKK